MDTPYWIPKPCENGHVFIWASNTTADTNPPKGVQCQCGLYQADGDGGILDKESEGVR
jgi:hypothetical protein